MIRPSSPLTMLLLRHTRRREFIAALGGAAAAWPLAARAQQRDRMRRIGVLMPAAADDRDAQDRVAAFLQGLQQSGWSVGRNVRIEYRWGTGDARRDAHERGGTDRARAGRHSGQWHRGHGAAAAGDPYRADRVCGRRRSGRRRLCRQPGAARRQRHRIFLYEFGLSGKWLELLKEFAPGVTRVAVIRDPSVSAGIGQFAAIQSVAPSLGVEVTPVDVNEAAEIERAVADFARVPNGGLVVTGGALVLPHRNLIIALAARHKLPAVYNRRLYVDDGGLISYGPDLLEHYRLAAGYVDRILKGEKPAELPVQAPTKYEMVHQPQDREGARHHSSAVRARPRRRGDRVRTTP